MFFTFAKKFKMKNISGNIFATIVLLTAFFSATYQIQASSEKFFDGEIDTTRISTVTFTVYGMDSSTVAGVQDKLNITEGVSFNFACWTDTIVFVEYDTVLTNPTKLMKAIIEMGYKPKIRVD
jgi:hypothetical protein